MARLESIAVGGYFPTPPNVTQLIANMLVAEPGVKLNLVDPCAGEGAAIFTLAAKLGSATVHTCEMEASRHKALLARAEADGDWWDTQLALHGDAFRVQLAGDSGRQAHLLYLNPPYDLDPVHARLEERFLDRFTCVLDRGSAPGLLVFVVPHYALKASAETLALEYEVAGDGLGCWRFPEPEYSVYRQVVLFARRVSERLEPDESVRAQVIEWSESIKDMLVLGEDPDAFESITVHGESWGNRVPWEMTAFDAVGLLAKAAPWKQCARPGTPTVAVPHVLSELPVQDLSFRSYPLATPPRPAHIAAGIASGLFNGRKVSGNGPDLLVKGVFDREYRTIEEKKNKDGDVTAVVQVQQPKLVTAVLDLETRQYRTLSSEGLSELLESYGESLMGVMREQCPVLYDPLRHASDPLASTTRTLYTAQAHAARALVRLLTGPQRAAILLGEIGSGKTGTALTAAKTVLGDKGGRVLVLCPPHLLQSWANEAAAVVPEATVVVMNSVDDVDACTERNSGFTIAVLSRETAKLGHGWVGVDPRLGCPRCGSTINEAPETLAKKRMHCDARPRRACDALARVMRDLVLSLGPCAPKNDRVTALLQGRHLERTRARWAADGVTPAEWTGMPSELVARAAAALVERIATGEFPDELPRALGHVLLGQPDAAIEATVRALASAASDRWIVAEVQRGLCVLLSAERAAQLDAEVGVLAKQYHGATVVDMIEQAGRPDYESGYPTRVGRVRRVSACAEQHTQTYTTLDGHEPRSLASALEALAKLSGEWRAPKLPCGEPLYQAVPEPRRVPLASYIAKRHPRAFDLLVLDEGHEYATDGSAQERAAHRLTALGMPTILATGSIMNGYASSLFTNMWALSADFRREFGRDEQQRFIDRFGYRKRILSEKDKQTGKVVEFGAHTDRVERTERMAGDAPGVLPLFLFRHLLGISVTLHKTDLALDLPPCRQIRHDIEAGEELHAEYSHLLSALKSAIKSDQFQPERSGKLFGQLSEMPSYLDRAWRDFEVRYPESLGSELVARAEALPGLQAKEEWIIETLRAELAEGRRVMVFTWHVDVLPRLQQLIFDRLGEDAPILLADKVPTAKRQAWIDTKIVKPGKRVMLANPVCIQTGLNNLVWFSSQVWVENPACNPTIFRQAIGRVDRIGQKASETRIHLPVYVGTLQEQLYSLLLRKVAVAVSADGLDPESALAAAGASDDGYLSGLSLGKQLWEMMSNEKPQAKPRARKAKTVEAPVKPLAPDCKHIGTCASADAAAVEFAERVGLSWKGATHNDALVQAAEHFGVLEHVSVPAPRVHSASGIALAQDCRRAWAHCYVDKIRKPEMPWEGVLVWEEWAKVHGYWSTPADNSGVVKPVAGQRSASLGTRTHLYAQWYTTGVATADADVYGPRRLIDWESLPGQVLQSMLPLLPAAGSVRPEQAEAEFELEVAGSEGQTPVKFRGLIDLLLEDVWDHKTTRDIRAYALLPDEVASALGAPERSLKNALQSCIYALHRARQSDPPSDAVTCRWTYGETDRSRRALPVVQEIPYAHALGVVERAADVARTLTYASADEAPPNTLSCDKYGGCWYRGQPCKVRRDYGRIALQLEKEETKMGKTMSFAELQKATAAANGKAPAAAAPAAATAKAAPATKPAFNAGGNPGVVAAKPAAKFVPKKPVKAAPAPEPEPEAEDLGEETTEEETADAETPAQGFDVAALVLALDSDSDVRAAVRSIIRDCISIG